MSKAQKITITTPDHGTFYRTTARAYKFAVVWDSERCRGNYANFKAGRGCTGPFNEQNRGFGVTWHGSKELAEKAAARGWVDDCQAKLVGIFPVDGTEDAAGALDEMMGHPVENLDGLAVAPALEAPKVPTCEAWAAGNGPLLAEFLDWLHYHGDVSLETVDGCPRPADQSLVCRFLEIDEKELEAERRSILDAMRNIPR